MEAEGAKSQARFVRRDYTCCMGGRGLHKKKKCEYMMSLNFNGVKSITFNPFVINRNQKGPQPPFSVSPPTELGEGEKVDRGF